MQYLNARRTLQKLIEWGVVPVINENDTTATDEISFGDNDILAAQVSILLSADLLVVLSDVDALFTTAVERYGSVDVCVCNAAIYSPPAPAVDIDADRFRRIVETNLTGTFLVARAFLRQVARQGSGNLILVGSTAGIFGEEGQADYAATKAALTGGLLPTLKNEIARLAPRGRVNAVCPGWTETEMAAPALTEPGRLERITQTMPMRKVAQPDDVAWQIVVLASDRLSGHVSGQVVVVAGGMEGRLLHEA